MDYDVKKHFQNFYLSLALSFFLLILLSACSTFRQDSSLFQNKIDSLITTGLPVSTQTAISIHDLTNNKPIFAHNDKILFRPASNQKLLTTVASLLFLGPEYKFNTSVYYTGTIQDSVCDGNVFIVGGLDPDFTTADLDSLVRSVKRFGIKKIKGNLYADVSAMDTISWGEGWMWDDEPGWFAPRFSTLIINDNCVKVLYEPGEVEKPAHVNIFPKSSQIELVNNTVTTDSGKTVLKFDRRWSDNKNIISVKGKILRDARLDSITLSIRNPINHFLDLAKESLSRNGILLSGTTDTLSLPAESHKIFSFQRDIKKVIANTDKNSDNLSAEMLLRTIGLERLGKPSSAAKGKIFLDSLIFRLGFNPNQFMIADGSGMSFYDLSSAELIISALKFAQSQEQISLIIMNSLSIAGIDGTLANRFKNSSAQKNVIAKTGSLRGVNNLSGYINTKNGNLIAFVIFVQNFSGSTQPAKLFQEKICELIYENL